MENFHYLPKVLVLATSLQNLAARSSEFVSLVQKNQRYCTRLEKKLQVFEKFQGINRLSTTDLEKLERHFNRGLNEIKEERIKRNYLAKINELKRRLGEEPDDFVRERSTEQKKDALLGKCEELLSYIHECENLDLDNASTKEGIEFMKNDESIYRTLDEKFDSLEITAKKYEKVPNSPQKTSPKKIRQFSLGCPLEETVKETDPLMNEQIPGKVSDFSDNSYKSPESAIFTPLAPVEEKLQNSVIEEVMNSTIREKETNDLYGFHAHDHHRDELSPDFSFKSVLNSRRNCEEKELNLSFDLANANQRKREKKSMRNKSVSLIPMTDSLNFSFHLEDEINGIKTHQEKLSQSVPKDNLYLMRLSKEIK